MADEQERPASRRRKPTLRDEMVRLDDEERRALRDLVLSHDRIFMGYPDRDAVPIRHVPGLLAELDEMKGVQRHMQGQITAIEGEVSSIKLTIAGLPEITAIVNKIKGRGMWAAVVVIACLIAVILKQWGLVPSFLGFLK